MMLFESQNSSRYLHDQRIQSHEANVHLSSPVQSSTLLPNASNVGALHHVNALTSAETISSPLALLVDTVRIQVTLVMRAVWSHVASARRGRGGNTQGLQIGLDVEELRLTPHRRHGHDYDSLLTHPPGAGLSIRLERPKSYLDLALPVPPESAPVRHRFLRRLSPQSHPMKRAEDPTIIMSKQPSDSFLPSGGFDQSRRPDFRSHSISPMAVPRSVPGYSPQSRDSPTAFLQSRSPSHPVSPPKTRSASADDNAASLVEDWRTYTAKLRMQNEGERAHMAADRARMEEIMAEERDLWDKERDILRARIAELEKELANRGNAFISPPISQLNSAMRAGPHPMSFTSQVSNMSNTVSSTGSIEGKRYVPQESGRNADGSPFYAPAPTNPSRTFEPSPTSDLRVDDLTAPRESAIRVTSKELTSSDFIHSPPNELPSISETPVESIDISHIQPELEGVPIKASAVSPTFAAKVLSPVRSPSKLSPNIQPPPRDISNLSRSNSSRSNTGRGDALDVVRAPENRRLTMHAGHTPNHSISKLDFLDESGNATPTQLQIQKQNHPHNPSMTTTELHNSLFSHPEEDISDDGDNELIGPLGLNIEPETDDIFLARLVAKLEEAKRSAGVSPVDEKDEEAVLSPLEKEEELEAKMEDLPPLRLKPSFNFGRPMGSM
ncbi:hypothetical protein B7494_g7609 [Chlorociboria aeruginascens]|nr:hypothetical protein B7494_g7609 [Chlorociboria aeruginascens]